MGGGTGRTWPADGTGPTWPAGGAGPAWPAGGAGPAAGALLDEALAALRGLAPREWRSPAAAGYAYALAALAVDVELARGALRSADDAVRRHRAELAAVRTVIGG